MKTVIKNYLSCILSCTCYISLSASLSSYTCNLTHSFPPTSFSYSLSLFLSLSLSLSFSLSLCLSLSIFLTQIHNFYQFFPIISLPLYSLFFLNLFCVYSLGPFSPFTLFLSMTLQNTFTHRARD